MTGSERVCYDAGYTFGHERTELTPNAILQKALNTHYPGWSKTIGQYNGPLVCFVMGAVRGYAARGTDEAEASKVQP